MLRAIAGHRVTAVGLLLIAVRRAGRRTAVPFGPFMLVASWASILGASGLGQAYLQRIGA